MKKFLFFFSLMLLSTLWGFAQGGFINHPISEGPEFNQKVEVGTPRDYYDAGGADRNMPGNLALTNLRLHPLNTNSHIVIVFESMEIGATDEMRIYEGLQSLHNYYNPDWEEYVYDWPKDKTPVFSTKGTPAKQKFVVSAKEPGGQLTVVFRCNSKEKGWVAKVYAVKNGDPDPTIEEKLPNLSFQILSDLGTDADGESIDEKSVTLSLAAAKDNTPIRIDWGRGPQDYVISSAENTSTVTENVEAGGEVKIYGDLTLFDASGNRALTKIVFNDAANLQKLRLSQNKIESLLITKLVNLEELSVSDNKIAALDVSNQPLLKELYAAWNPYSELRLTQNPKLEALTCYNTGIDRLDLSANSLLKILYAGGNNYTENIDLSANKKLESVDLENSKITSLVLPDLPALKKLKLSGNALSSFSLPSTPLLEEIDLSGNRLDACAINDFLFTLPRSADSSGKILKLAKNPGIEGASTHWAKKFGWKADREGNGTGCATVRIKQEAAENGSYVLNLKGNVVKDWEAIPKNSEVSIFSIANTGYKADKNIFNGKEIAGDEFVADDYGFFLVVFKQDALSVEKSNIQISPKGSGYEISGLSPGENYEVFDISGKTLENGVVDKWGKIEIERSEKILLIKQGAYLLKLMQ